MQKQNKQRNKTELFAYNYPSEHKDNTPSEECVGFPVQPEGVYQTCLGEGESGWCFGER